MLLGDNQEACDVGKLSPDIRRRSCAPALAAEMAISRQAGDSTDAEVQNIRQQHRPLGTLSTSHSQCLLRPNM